MIAGFWDSRFPLPLVTAAVWLDGITDRWDLITFVVDTGATHSCIHPLDAVRKLRLSSAELDPANWPAAERSEGIGGSALYRSMSASYAFLHRQNAEPPELINGGTTIQLAELAPHNQGLPSLLGWDVLQHFRLIIDRTQVIFDRL